MRGLVWGFTIGLLVAVAAGYAVALWNWEYPFYRNKVASQDAITFTRELGAPIGALLGALVGDAIQFIREKRRAA